MLRLKLENVHFSTSEQQLVDCTGSNGCNGGDYTVAWNYIVGNGGQDKSSAYSYTGTVILAILYIQYNSNSSFINYVRISTDQHASLHQQM